MAGRRGVQAVIGHYRTAAALLAFTLLGAAPAPRVIPHPGGGPALVVPSDSPVRFTGFDKDGAAHFSGRFELSGAFIYGCEHDCEGPISVDDLSLQLVPDEALAERLPHWQERGDRMAVYIDGAARLTSSVIGRRQKAALLSGRLADVRGHITITVDDYAADFGCDYSPFYSARFVALAMPPKLAQIELDGAFGC
jgi:hypothetical protein